MVLSLAACGSESADKAKADASDAKTTAATAEAKKTKAEQNIPVIKKTQPKNTRPQPAAVALADYKAKNEGWMVNFEDAKAKSIKSGKPILANFTGSDWCGWCKRLDKSVFHQPGFKEWADKNVVLLELDFPRRFRVPNEIAAQNNGLKQAMGIRGFPTIWLFDMKENPEGQMAINPLGKTGYTKTLNEFQQTIEGFLKKKG